jgi:hypothetical protein
MSSPENPGAIRPVEPPWSDAIVMVCNKCFQRRQATGGSTGELGTADELKSYLKSELKHRLGKGRVRAVVSTCLDVCPEDRLAIAIARRTAQPGVETITVGFEMRRPDLCDALIRKTTG